jgi:hypothetical protein
VELCFFVYQSQNSFISLDQRVVYNFLEKLNTEENKPTEKPAEAPQAKNLDDVLNNLKK